MAIGPPIIQQGVAAPPIIMLHVIVYNNTISCMYFGFVDFITQYYIMMFWSTPPNTLWPPNTKLVPTPLQYNQVRESLHQPNYASSLYHQSKPLSFSLTATRVTTLWLKQPLYIIILIIWICWYCFTSFSDVNSLGVDSNCLLMFSRVPCHCFAI